MSNYTPRLLDNYNKEIKSSLSDKLSISNSMRIPKLLKISIIDENGRHITTYFQQGYNDEEE